MRIRKIISFWTFVATVIWPLALWAQSEFESYGVPVPNTLQGSETFPERPLALDANQSQAYTGFGLSLYEDIAGKQKVGGWRIPLGGGIGLIKDLEIGLNSSLLLDPLKSRNLVDSLSFYGRYAILPNLLAAELTAYVPTLPGQRFGIRLVAPMRYQSNSWTFFGLGQFLYWGETPNRDNSVDLGISISSLYSITGNVFAVLDTGFVYKSEGNSNHLVVPFGIGGGYRFSNGTMLKGMIVALNLAGKNAVNSDYNGHKNISFQLMVVQPFELFSGCPSCSSYLENPVSTMSQMLPSTCPDCPSCPQCPECPKCQDCPACPASPKLPKASPTKSPEQGKKPGNPTP